MYVAVFSISLIKNSIPSSVICRMVPFIVHVSGIILPLSKGPACIEPTLNT